MAAILNFGIFAKNAKTQNTVYAISLTVRDRAILSKFSTLRVSRKYTKPSFLKNFQKWRPFRVFEFLPKMQAYKIYAISLTVRDGAIFDPQGYLR